MERIEKIHIKEVLVMKKYQLMILAVLLMGLALKPVAADTVTNMVEKKMNSYVTREMLPSDLSIMVGLPLILGVEYDRSINAMFSVGVGAGSFISGTSLNIQGRVEPLAMDFSPYAGAGVTYYFINTDMNVLAWHADLGVEYTFLSGWGLSLGVTYAKFLGTSVNPFTSAVNVSNLVDAANAQVGMHFRF